MEFEVEISSGIMTAIHVFCIDLILAWLIVTGVDDILAARQRHKWFDNGKERSSVIRILKAGPFGDYAGTKFDNCIRVGTAIAALILAVMTGLGFEGFSKQTWRTQEINRIVLDHEKPLNYSFDDLVVDRNTQPRRSRRNLLLARYLSCWASTEKEDIWAPAIIGEEGEFVRCLDVEEAEVNGLLKLWPRSSGIGTNITCSPTSTQSKFSHSVDMETVRIGIEDLGPTETEIQSVSPARVDDDDLNATETAKMPKDKNCTWEGMTFTELTCSEDWCVGFGRNADGSDVIFKSDDTLLQNSTWRYAKTKELTSVVVPGLDMNTLDSKRLLIFYLAGYDIGRSLQIVSTMASEKARMKIKTGTTAATKISSWYVPVVGGFLVLAMALRLVKVIVYGRQVDLRGMHDRLDISGMWSLYVNAEKGGNKSHMKCEYKNIEIGWNAGKQHFGVIEEASVVEASVEETSDEETSDEEVSVEEV